jgi:hypothetical protein
MFFFKSFFYYIFLFFIFLFNLQAETSPNQKQNPKTEDTKSNTVNYDDYKTITLPTITITIIKDEKVKGYVLLKILLLSDENNDKKIQTEQFTIADAIFSHLYVAINHYYSISNVEQFKLSQKSLSARIETLLKVHFKNLKIEKVLMKELLYVPYK